MAKVDLLHLHFRVFRIYKALMEINGVANINITLKHGVQFCDNCSQPHSCCFLYVTASISGHQGCAHLVGTDAEIPDCHDAQHFLTSFRVHSIEYCPLSFLLHGDSRLKIVLGQQKHTRFY